VRIVSLVPSGTEIVCALGAGDQLVGVTHDCDYPEWTRELPRVTRSTIPAGSSSREIDTRVREAGERGESTFHLDAAALTRLRPDLIVGQTLCAVCAVTLDQLPASLDPAPPVVPLTGTTLAGVLEDVSRTADALGRADVGAKVVAALRARLAAVVAGVATRRRPRVVCLEWTDPLFNAGHWVPEQVDLAGGRDALGAAGVPSRVIDWAEVRAAEPEVLVVMPCGFGRERATSETRSLQALPGWDELPAVRDGRVHPVDGNAYFSRPGPRVVDGVELLASLLHPSAGSGSTS
jgi:iron complex transport system substrate-binding protein